MTGMAERESTDRRAKAAGRWVRGLAAYYLGTPAFAVVDFLFHIPVRVALPDGWARGAYYAAAFGLGVVCRRFPRTAPWVGMGESAANLLLLCLAVLLPIWSAPDALLAGGGLPASEMMMHRVVNLAIGGTVMVVSFHRSRAELAGSGLFVGRR